MNYSDIHSQPRWKARLNRGAGEVIVHGRTFAEAKNQALAEYRRKKGEMDFCTADEIIDSLELIDQPA